MRYIAAASAVLAMLGAGSVASGAVQQPAAHRRIVVTTSIQTAVDAAGPGDTVVVPAGMYREAVTVSTPGLTIEGGPDGHGYAWSRRPTRLVAASNATCTTEPSNGCSPSAWPCRPSVSSVRPRPPTPPQSSPMPRTSCVTRSPSCVSWPEGIHRAILSERGLGPSVDQLAQRVPVPVTASVELAIRLPAEVETTAYFVVSEALTNVMKHAHASRVSVTLRLAGDALAVEVADDGAGGAAAAPGSGLAGLADRVAALDGELAITSPPGGGTVLTALLPTGSDMSPTTTSPRPVRPTR